MHSPILSEYLYSFWKAGLLVQLLITGGAGFIGSHSVEAAKAAGYNVRVFDNLSSGSRENVPDKVELVVGDITNAAQVRGGGRRL